MSISYSPDASGRRRRCQGGGTKVLGEIGQRRDDRRAGAVHRRTTLGLDRRAARRHRGPYLARALIERAIARPARQGALSMTRLVIERSRREGKPAAGQRGAGHRLHPARSRPAWTRCGFARHAARASSRQSLGSIAVLMPRHSLGDDMQRQGAVKRHDRADRAADTARSIWLPDAEDDAWTRFCLQHADEILLLGDATAEPALSEIEEQPADATAAPHHHRARRRWCCCTDTDTMSPRGTVALAGAARPPAAPPPPPAPRSRHGTARPRSFRAARSGWCWPAAGRAALPISASIRHSKQPASPSTSSAAPRSAR